MKRTDFTLFFSMPLDAQDWKNLQLAQVRRVMLPWAIVPDPAVFAAFRNRGIKLTLRMSDTQARRIYSIAGEADQQWMHGQEVIDTVILGCEPENGIPWTWGADWKLGQAWEHQARVQDLANVVRARMPGVAIISPGWTQRGYTETDAPEPGLVSWREICAPVYNACDGNGVHIYQHSYSSQLDEVRLLLQVRKWGELRHRALYIDEIGINEGDEAHRVECYLRLARMLLTPVGDRVAMLCPFVSNGVPTSWDARYLIRSEESYRKIGAFMEGQ